VVVTVHLFRFGKRAGDVLDSRRIFNNSHDYPACISLRREGEK
jgi:hypothetical protein